MDLKRLAVCLSSGQQLYGSEAFGLCLSSGQQLYGSEAFGRVSVVRTAAVWI